MCDVAMLTAMPLKEREKEGVHTRCKVIGETAGAREVQVLTARQTVKV